jgi:Flp pilus assembly protein TadG
MKRQRTNTAAREDSSVRRTSTRRRRFQGDSRLGVSTVEFAIVANILFIMILTCMEFARMNMVRNLAQDAAYFGARHAIVPGATAAEAIEQAELVLSSMLSNGYTVTVSDLDSEASEINVNVAVDLTEVAMFAPYFLKDTTIETDATMRTERYDHFYEQ